MHRERRNDCADCMIMMTRREAPLLVRALSPSFIFLILSTPEHSHTYASPHVLARRPHPHVDGCGSRGLGCLLPSVTLLRTHMPTAVLGCRGSCYHLRSTGYQFIMSSEIVVFCLRSPFSESRPTRTEFNVRSCRSCVNFVRPVHVVASSCMGPCGVPLVFFTSQHHLRYPLHRSPSILDLAMQDARETLDIVQTTSTSVSPTEEASIALSDAQLASRGELLIRNVESSEPSISGSLPRSVDVQLPSELSDVVQDLDVKCTLPTKEQVIVLTRAISCHEHEISMLEARINKLRMEVGHYQLFLSPIRILPPEILIKIFRFSMPGVHVPPKSTNAPLLLCHICSKWRNIVLNLLELWSTLVFPMAFSTDPGPFSHREAHRHVEVLKFWFTQAQSHCLTFIFRTRERNQLKSRRRTFPKHWQLSAVFDAIFRALSSYSTRLKTLVFCVDDMEDLQQFLLSTALSLPSLETLVFRLADLDYDQWNVYGCSNLSARWPVFRDAPRLHQVNLQFADGLHHQLDLPYAQLTQLNLGLTIISVSEFRHKLESCTLMRSGVFLIGNPSLSNHPPSPDIHPQACTEVMHLTIELSSSWHADGLLDSRVFHGLTFPALRTFRVGSPYAAKNFPWIGTFHNLSNQISLNLLHSFFLSNIEISTEELLEVLSNCLCLVHLYIDVIVNIDRLLQYMTYPPQTPLYGSLTALEHICVATPPRNAGAV
ncbi:hypothetical protein Hypma_014631 [Hypsizygus marmoreus]|uniref:Uncharacterized protein n=1 Tax=Hypsizygus marmoreus TaxID=39966 RepID=A0A369JBB9_HYPMA|nr:hypothetical protein Hypma_014631 [Hypsizygus marmoreus]